MHIAAGGVDPASVQVARGKIVVWINDDAVPHRVKDGGLGLVDTGALAPAGWGIATYGWAGTFDWRLDGVIAGSVRVPVTVSPAQGTEATDYIVTWATAAAPVGYVYDVQIRKPGADTWVAWRPDTTAASSAFHPGAGSGTYRFRARIERVATGVTSEWSPTDALSVS